MKKSLKRILSCICASAIAVGSFCIELPINPQNNYTCTAMAFSIMDEYPNTAIYTAESIIQGMIDFETGKPMYNFVTKYDDVSHRDYTYEQLAQNVMDNKALLITSTMWDTFSKALEGKLSAIDTSLRQEQVYEIFLADYLTFSEGSTSNKSALDKAGEFASKTASVESEIMEKLLEKGIASDENELVKLIESSDSLSNEKVAKALSELGYEKKLQGYTKIVGDIKGVATNAATYYKALAKAMALKEVNDERIAFLKKMAENAADIGDDEFVTAANKIIAIIESSYAEIALNQGAKQMASYAVNKVWGKLKDAISDYIPGLKAIETTKEAMDYLFNSTEAAESNIRIVMQYTAGQYALRAMNTAYHNYSTGRTEENAAVFNAAYKNYLAYQDYSSEWAKDFVYAHTLASATTVENCLTALNSDINYCNNAIMFADKFAKIYNAYAYPNVDVSTSQPSGDEEKGQEEEIEDINTNTSYHSTYAIKQKLTLTGDMNVNGDLYVYAGLDLNGYTLNVTGSVIIEETGYLRMKSSSSNLTIGGDFTTKSSVGLHFSYESYNYFSGGSITIGGDLYQEYASVDNFSLNGTKLNFVGNETHLISSACSETDINNFTSEGFLDFKGKFGNISLSDDITIVDNMTSFSSIKTNGYNLNVNGDFNQTGTITMDIAKLDGGELNISGNYTSNSDLSISAVEVKVNVGGNCNWNAGILTLAEDTVMTVNGDFVTNSKIVPNGTLKVDGNFTIDEKGYLRMKSSSSNLNIGGNFTTKSSIGLHFSYESYNYFSGGLITIGGDFYQSYASVDNFSLNGTKLNFVGSKTHLISSACSGTDISNFTSDGTLDLKGRFGNLSLGGDITIIDNMTSFSNINTNGYNLDVNGDFNQSGSITMENGSFDGGNFNVSGDYKSTGAFSATNATININGNCTWNSNSFNLNSTSTMNVGKDFTVNAGFNPNGTLIVNKNFTIGEKGYLRMKSTSSNLTVGGDFITKSSIGLHFSYESYNYFSAGSITIGGGLYQSYSSVDNFSLNGTELIFVGKGKHTISALNNGTDISNLTLADGVVIELSGNMNGFTGIKNCTLSSSDTGVVSVKSNTITPKAMGKATVTITDSNNKTSSIAVKVKEGVRGDANMDGEVNIADAVMLQKWLLGTGSLPNWKSMDLCEDGKIDVFDMVAMRKLLIEKTK